MNKIELKIIKDYVDKKVLNGLSGKSAYQIAVENGYTGTQEEWLESLHGTGGGSEEYDDTELKELISEKAPTINIQTLSSYDTDFSTITDKAEDYDFFVNIPNNQVGHNYQLLSKGENLLPVFSSVTPANSSNGVTVEFINNNSVKLNGTCTGDFFIIFRATGSTFNINKALVTGDNVSVGVISSGSNTGSMPYCSFAFRSTGGNTSKAIYFSGSNVIKENLTIVSNTSTLSLDIKIRSGNVFENYIITPFAFFGNTVNIVENAVYPYSADLEGYDYLSTYPNKHTVSYIADTKKYIDAHSSDIDIGLINQSINTTVNPIKTDVNTLNKKVTYITPEQYGAVGDGATDDTTALQTCLSHAGSSVWVRAMKYYKITQPVRIASDECVVEINRINYTGDDFAVKIATRSSSIRIKQINASNGGGVLIKNDNSANIVNANLFEFNYIDSNNNCIKFETVDNTLYHIAYNHFTVPCLISRNSNAININYSCAECVFTGARIVAQNGWAIYGSTNTITFRDFCFEAVVDICYGIGKFRNCRVDEGLNYYDWKGKEGTFIKPTKITTSHGSLISDGEMNVTFRSIDVSELTTFEQEMSVINQKIADSDPNDPQRYYNACYNVIEYTPGVVSRVNRYHGSYGDNLDMRLNGKCIIYWNKKAYVPNFKTIDDITVSPFTPLDTIPNNPTYFKIGIANCIINLNDSYCPVGIDSFIVEQTDNYKATIYNKDNVLIFDGENRNAGIYEVKSYITPLPSNIFNNINMPQGFRNEYAQRIRHMYTGSNEEWKVTAIYDGDLIEKKDFSFSIPPVIYTGLNGETKIYYRNILSPNYLMHWGQYTNATTIKETDDYISLVGTSAASKNIPYFIVDRGYKIIANGTTSIKINSVAPSSQTMLCLGDSFISYNYIGRQLKTLFTEDGNTLTLIGTKGTSTHRHEGYAGWKITDFINSEKASQNPFWNSEESNFDFSYYMSSNNFSNLDSVYIQLGTNDCSASTLTNNYTNSINAMQTIISSILEYNSNIKIYLGLTVMPTLISENFAVRYNGIGVPWVMRLNMQRLNEALIKAFSNNSSVKIVATNCVLDSSTDILDNVHPTEDGFKKITQQLYYTMMS